MVYAKHKGKPCPKFDGLIKISNCEAEGFADDSVPDCDSKIDIPATWSKWSSWTGCRSDYCGIQGKVIYSYKLKKFLEHAMFCHLAVLI